MDSGRDTVHNRHDIELYTTRKRDHPSKSFLLSVCKESVTLNLQTIKFQANFCEVRGATRTR